MIELSDEAHAELVSRLTALLGLAKELQDAFDDSETSDGAQRMVDSIERMLGIVSTPRPGLD